MRKEVFISLERKISEVETQIADLKRRWPAHSVKNDMVMQLDELEDLLETLNQKLREAKEETSEGEVDKK